MTKLTILANFFKVGDKISITIPDTRWWKIWWHALLRKEPPERIKYFKVIAEISATEIEIEPKGE